MFIPTIPYIINIKKNNIQKSSIRGIDRRIVLISNFISRRLLIVLKGRRILITLITEIEISEKIYPNQPTITTIKSKTFQGSRR
jgi:hypothetical protein